MIWNNPAGRNDPCPCGSGRKYKKCCADSDGRRERTLGAVGLASGTDTQPRRRGAPPGGTPASMHEALREAARSGDWQVDAVALPIAFDETPDDRAVAVLVVAAGLVLEAELITMRSAEPEELARVLMRRLGEAARAHQHWPLAVHIRHESIAPSLGRLLMEHGVSVLIRPELPGLDDATRGLADHMKRGSRQAQALGEAGWPLESAREAGPIRPMVSSPERWRAWGLGDDLVARIFEAAARFHTSRPWRLLANSALLDLRFPDGNRWTASVMGNGGEEFGLVMYTEREDILALFDAPAGSASSFARMRGSSVTVGFGPREEVPAGMRREIAAARWHVAGSDAYPRLWCLNTPGGGISRAWAEDVAMALDAIPRFTELHERVLASQVPPDSPLTWLDPASGTIVGYSGDLLETAPPLWPPPVALAPAAATGAGVSAGAGVIDDESVEGVLAREREVAGEFARWMAAGGPGRRLTTRTIDFHARIAEAFIDFLVGHQQSELAALHEMDLRVFLYDWFPRKVAMARTEAMRVPVSLGRFLDFLSVERGITCPWAAGILGDRHTFAVRWEERPAGFFWDAEVTGWRGELAADLHRRVFIPAIGLTGAGEWGDVMGERELRLYTELQRLWLRWRDELVGEGITDPDEVRRLLVQRQRAWEVTPHVLHEGLTPGEVVRREREKG